MQPAADEARNAPFVLIPGAGGMAWCWHRIVPLLDEGAMRAPAAL
jgi:hypothetical protein